MTAGEASIEPVRKRLRIEGRVQGVFYRDSCRRRATELRIAGSAENLDDGAVEVVLEGDPQTVAMMIDWCRKGPPSASVSEVTITDEPPKGLAGFDIA